MIEKNKGKWIGLGIGSILVMFFMWGSVIWGLTKIDTQMVIDSFLHFDGSNEHIIIQDTRIPRSLICCSSWSEFSDRRSDYARYYE